MSIVNHIQVRRRVDIIVGWSGLGLRKESKSCGTRIRIPVFDHHSRAHCKCTAVKNTPRVAKPFSVWSKNNLLLAAPISTCIWDYLHRPTLISISSLLFSWPSLFIIIQFRVVTFDFLLWVKSRSFGKRDGTNGLFLLRGFWAFYRRLTQIYKCSSVTVRLI